MSRYIDADALKASYIVTSTTTNSLCHLYVSIEDINNAPSIDIVRCKECIFADCDDKAEMYRCCSVSFPHWNKGEHFCADGERREP